MMPVKSFTICSLIIVLTVSSATAEAANRYVRAGAAGSGSGSDWANAYSALPATLVRGDVYYVSDGTYGGYTFDDPASGSTMITIRKATVASHGTDTGWSNTYGDGVATFNGTIRFRTSYYAFDGVTGGGPGSWTSGHGFKIVQTQGDPGVSSGGPGASAGSFITVSHVEIQGNDGADQGGGSIGNDGVAAYGGSNITISYAYIHDMGRTIMFLSTRDFVLEYSYTGDHRSTSGTHSELASIWDFAVQTRNVTFRYNVMTHAEGTGGIIMHGDGLYVYGNVFYRPSSDTRWTHGNGMIGTWTSSTLTNAKIYNNTFINVDEGPVFGTLYTPPTSGNEARNNIFYNVPISGLGNLFPTYSHNHYINSSQPGSETGRTTGSGDPFVNSSGLDFGLKAATTAGTALPAPYNVDMLGRTRGSDGTWDKGAIDFGGGSTTTPPPAAPSNLRIITSP